MCLTEAGALVGIMVDCDQLKIKKQNSVYPFGEAKI